MTIKIETPRMLLRLIKDEDLDQVAQLHADDDLGHGVACKFYRSKK